MSLRPPMLVLLLAIGLFTLPQASAQDAGAAKIDRLLEVVRAKDMTDGLLVQFGQMQQEMMAQAAAGHALDEERKARLDAIITKSDQQVREILAWESLLPLYRDIYTQTFSNEDIDAMLEFYSSPSGQRVLDRMPELMQNTMAAVQRLILPMLQQMEQDFRNQSLAE
ncbi:MAG: DUF2059 domain-containing protein [Luteimonas sp.]|nr:DUF2059 domain-containing protein [Luteimonas sp.]